MERLVKGDIVVVNFPFSDLSSSKKRPAVVLAPLEGEDLILAQITSTTFDKYSIPLRDKDFALGKLLVESYIRPNKLFTAARSLILYKVGTLQKEKTTEIVRKIVDILERW